MQVEAEPPLQDEVTAAGKDIQHEIEPFPMTPTKGTALTKVSAAHHFPGLCKQLHRPVCEFTCSPTQACTDAAILSAN